MFRTSNPAFRQDAFAPAQTWDEADRPGSATYSPEASAASD